MNNEIRQLQVLNDLIALTLDAINQRALVANAPVAGGLAHTPYYGWDTRGLAHTPFTYDPRFGYDPRFINAGYHTGFNTGFNTGFVADPRVAAVPTWGLNHTTAAVDPRFVAARNYWMDPRVTYPNYIW